MRKNNRPWIVAGIGILAVVAVLAVVRSQSTSLGALSGDNQDHSEVDANTSPDLVKGEQIPVESGEQDIQHDDPGPDFVDQDGVLKTYGDRIRFSDVADCTETFRDTLQGDVLATHDCGPSRLQVDHPYGVYTIEQLEYAANEMNDGDAAYILAERFASEKWRNRRGDAHTYYVKAFLLTSDSEIYTRMLGEMGFHGGIPRKNGELDVQALSANYTMLRVGQMFGAIDDKHIDWLAAVANESQSIDFDALDLEAYGLYQSMLQEKRTLQWEP